MPNPRVPAGTRIYIQSAISAAQQVTAISKEAPPVITYAGADPANNDYAALVDMQGMTEFEDSLVKVANVNAAGNTFEALDQDSTAYGTFVSGNLQLVTLATELLAATGFSISGGDQQFAEYTYLWDRITRKKPTTKSGLQIDLPMIWDPQDAGSKALLAAADASAKRGFKVLFPDGLEMLFFGFVGASGLPSAQDANSVMQTTVTISAASRVRYIFPA